MKNSFKKIPFSAEKFIPFGAAFITANSVMGPGFLIQTSVFTEKLLYSFFFGILFATIVSIIVQLNIWKIITVSGLRVQDLANHLLKNSGYPLSLLVIFGGLAFNIANVSGSGLALNVLFGIDFRIGAAITAMLIIILFLLGNIGKMLDKVATLLGIIKISLVSFIAYKAQPPILKTFETGFSTQSMNAEAIFTIIGGTVGGYICFAGAHRLIDGKVYGLDVQKKITTSSLSSMFIAAFMRYIFYFAVLGVVVLGFQLDKDNPAKTVFSVVGGQLGLTLFGVLLWLASISTILAASYTSISFCKTWHPSLQKNEKWLIIGFILLSSFIFVLIGKPKFLLILAGKINAFILPILLSVVLGAALKKDLVKNYQHSKWLMLGGWFIVIILFTLGIITVF